MPSHPVVPRPPFAMPHYDPSTLEAGQLGGGNPGRHVEHGPNKAGNGRQCNEGSPLRALGKDETERGMSCLRPVL